MAENTEGPNMFERERPAPMMEPIKVGTIEAPLIPTEAMYGLLGQISVVLHEFTGLDLAGLYRCLVNAVGNVIGRNRTTRLDSGPEQQAHLGDVLVGPTAVGKDRIYRAVLDYVMSGVDARWCAERFFENVRSDAALVHIVRDQKVASDGTVKDPGAGDTRAWMVEREFSRLLKDMRRPDAALSEQVRKSLDGPYLGNTTKTASLNERASQAHIGWICLTTPTDLNENLDSSSVANGLANRFRMTLVREGTPTRFGDLSAAISPYVAQLRQAIKNSQGISGVLPLTVEVADALRRLEHGVSHQLRPGGLAGDMEARFLLHVMRVSLIHAVVAGHDEITSEVVLPSMYDRLHVAATNAIVLADRTGSIVADEVLRTLRTQHPEQVTMTALHQEFSNNVRAGQLRSALNLLSQRGLIEGHKLPASGRGRRAEVWRSTSPVQGNSSFNSLVRSDLRGLLNTPTKVTNNGAAPRLSTVKLSELLAGGAQASERHLRSNELNERMLVEEGVASDFLAPPRRRIRRHHRPVVADG